MKLSIIIPIYNVEKYIERCAESVLNQNVPPSQYEVIFVNDGTKDNSVEILKKAIDFNIHSNFQIRDKENGGLSSARNFGLEHATGDYVWFVDSDDWIESNCLEKIFLKLDATTPDILYIQSDEYISNRIFKRGDFIDFGVISGRKFLQEYRKYNYTQYYIYRRNYLDKFGFRFYLRLLHEDNEFTPRVLYYARRVASMDGECYHMYKREGSITTTSNPQKLFDLITIASRYKEYSKELPSLDKYLFYNVVGNNVNQTLFECTKYSCEIQQEVETLIYKGNFSRILMRCSILKYRIEGFLFTLFPKHTLKVYTFLQMFNGDKGGQKKLRVLAK